MKKLAFGALMIGLLSSALVACGGGGGNPDLIDAMGDDDVAPDAGPDIIACNPVEQSGCATGEKCSWINIDSANDLGTIGCVPNGTALETEACSYGEDGETTGYDDCVAGQICIGGACEAICTLSPDSCDSEHSCQRYAGLFEADPALFGACDFLCDPITQARLDDAAACASVDPTKPNRGCYGQFDDSFSCAGVPAQISCGTHGGTTQPGDPTSCTAQNATTNFGMYSQGDPAYGPTGGVYLNGCAPGFAPLLRSANDATAPVICMAFCDPEPTSSETPGGAGGLSPYSCADRNAVTEECRYFWLWEGSETVDPTHPNDLGFCWNPDNYIGDWDGDATTGDTPIPRCSSLSSADPDYAGWGCAPFVPGLTGGRPNLPFKTVDSLLKK